jgi:hypothetical protein
MGIEEMSSISFQQVFDNGDKGIAFGRFLWIVWDIVDVMPCVAFIWASMPFVSSIFASFTVDYLRGQKRRSHKIRSGPWHGWPFFGSF